MAVWRKNPRGEGAPLLSEMNNRRPKTFCVILYVSGLATRKNTSVE